MSWLVSQWAHWLAVGGGPISWSWAHETWVPDPCAGTEQGSDLTDLDLWLLHGIYAVIAAESNCERCGAPLGRGLRVAPSLPSLPVSVVTRCTGWRRHRHIAEVHEESHDLLLGPLHAH